MTVVAGGHKDRMGMWRVLAAWVSARASGGTGDGLVDAYVEAFTRIEASEVRESLQPAGTSLDLIDRGQWLCGPSMHDGPRLVVPIATVQLDGSKEQVTRCAIRLSLIQSRDEGVVHATGWRFEMAESSATASLAVHPYQHAQAIIGWTIGTECLIHPHPRCPPDCEGIDRGDEDVLNRERLTAARLVMQSHPAFPLGTVSLTGLAASLVATLHGAPQASAILDKDDQLGRIGGAPRADLERLLAW
ncbi:hypothetical protein [Janibacter sp. UYMM211]|uniref:hypothetical protein n=1 Tax=Janibacter sp. UYMM211 TaxID=3156342 RepID=UPI00339A2619